MKGAKGKRPTVQFYFNDVLGDRRLQACRPSTRGIWWNLLCHMWADGARGVLSDLTLDELGRLGGASDAEIQAFLADAKRHGFCDLEVGQSSDCPAIVLIVNRRMAEDHKQREIWRKRKNAWREKQQKDESHGDVLPDSVTSSTSSSIPTSENKDFSSEKSRPETPKKPPRKSAPKKPPCPVKKIVELYNEKLTRLPAVDPDDITDPLRTRIAARWKESPKRQDLTWWAWYFDGVAECDFLVGKKTDFAATLHWLTGPVNMTKVLSGQYVNRGGACRLTSGNAQAVDEFVKGG